MEPLAIAERIQKQFPDSVQSVNAYAGQVSIIIKKDAILAVGDYLRNDPDLAFDYLADLCGCDFAEKSPRFEVVYNLRSIQHNHLIRLKVQLPEDCPEIDSVFSLWAAADWFEREAYDMLGIRFKGHPDLRRLLLPEDWEGHPLRKDYPLEGQTESEWSGLLKVKELRQYDSQWQINANRPE
jgi:NADH-quinone oxidoreductase subunit C